jgi:hypothetical protein
MTLPLWPAGSTSGSPEFDTLRASLAADDNLREELEAALRANVNRIDPTDRANRFGSGAAVEWIIAAAAYQSGILSVPGGHNADGFDLQSLRDQVRGLWSVKNTTKASGFRLTNGMSGAGRGFTEAVILLSPALPGLTFAHPEAHPDLAAAVQQRDDHTLLPLRDALRHAAEHPECVAPIRMPFNPKTGRDDPWMDYVKSLLEPQRFPRLSKLFVDATPAARSLAGEIVELARLRDAGTITEAQFEAAVARVTSTG